MVYLVGGSGFWFRSLVPSNLTERKQRMDVPMSTNNPAFAYNPPSPPVGKMGDMHSLIQLKEQEVASLREAALQKLEAQVVLNLSAILHDYKYLTSHACAPPCS